MSRFIRVLISALLSGLRSRRDLVFENLALRQQLATVLQKHQPRIRPADRVFWILLRRFWSKWADAVIIVKPKTVVAWHRAGFALYWRWLSGSGRRPGRPSVDKQIRDLVRRMATENGWRATRIHGELLKLGFQVSERTVSRLCVPKTPNCPTSGELRGVRPASADSFVVAPRWANVLPS